MASSKKGIARQSGPAKAKIDWPRRLETAAIAIPTLVGVILYSGELTAISAVLATCVGYREVATLIGYDLHVLNYLFFYALYHFSLHPLVIFTGSVFNVFLPLLSQGPALGIRNGLINLFYTQCFAVPIMHVPLLRSLPGNGPFVLLVWVLLTFASDAGALVAGSAFGANLCCPAISPKKTWEGLLGAFVAAEAAALAFFVAGFEPSISLRDYVVMGAMAAVLGMTGDLMESGFKRFVAAKDASNLLPGHGGLLDRLDALAACAPAFYYYWKGW
jgi:CDP-diglyceride synthetase